MPTGITYSFSAQSVNNFNTNYTFNSGQYQHSVIFNKIENYFGSSSGVTHDMMWGVYVNDVIYYDYFKNNNIDSMTQSTLISIMSNYIYYYSADSKTNYIRIDFYPHTADNYKKAETALSVLTSNFGSNNVVQYDNRDIYVEFS